MATLSQHYPPRTEWRESSRIPPLCRQRLRKAAAPLPPFWRPPRLPGCQSLLPDGCAYFLRGRHVQIVWRTRRDKLHGSSSTLEIIQPEDLGLGFEGVRLGGQEQTQLGVTQPVLLSAGAPFQE